MKRYHRILSVLAVSSCLMAAGCSSGDTGISSVLGPLPEEIAGVEMSGFYDGSDFGPQELTQEEIEELDAWLQGLSLEHRTYAEGGAPNEVWSGGTSYRFEVNSGELSFTWAHIDKAYIVYEGEWYEIEDRQIPPFGPAV